MKISKILLGLFALTLPLASCTQPSTAEEDSLYVQERADGDEGEINNDPDKP